ncbi:hypothetical protein GCM10023169_39720 [Georgenia halophila]|uniref:DUF3040 domain-containing protein n=1 Tax=Georgenia halophila TaxID=620889 RepID=A0ABP8LR05_9MICO
MAGPSRDGANDPGPLDDATVAERWAELTAELGDLEVPEDPRRDDRSPRDRAAPDGAAPDGAAPGGGATPDDGDQAPAPRARPLGPRDYIEIEDPDEQRFVPPEPGPLEHTDPVLTLGWVATIGSLLLGLVLFVLASPGGWVMLALGAALLCGVALLLWRMPANRDDDDHSDGAVV